MQLLHASPISFVADFRLVFLELPFGFVRNIIDRRKKQITLTLGGQRFTRDSYSGFGSPAVVFLNQDKMGVNYSIEVFLQSLHS